MGHCKWCGGFQLGVHSFEDASVCGDCLEKAVWARQNPQPCELCNSMFTEKKHVEALLSEDGLPHSLIADLRASAEKGCPLCRLFLLQDPNPDSDRFSSSALVLFAETRKDSNGEFEDITSLFFWSIADQFKLVISVSALADDPAANYITQRPIPTNLANADTFQKAQTWLQECFSDHVETRNLSAKPRLPTRVIDVGRIGDTTVRLFEPNAPTYEKYITLSYCWGRLSFLTTTLGNLESHKKGIEISALPKTIQDAVIVTRGLGFQYVWIDALCIVQDSSDDKIKEIGVMGSIYHNATLTVAAVSAGAVAEGFLRPRPRPKVEIPYLCPNGSLGHVQLLPQKMIDLWQETMYTRGWCLQEYLLSGRLLLFTDTEVLWSCQEAPFKHSESTHVTYNYELPTHAGSPFRRLPAAIFISEEPKGSAQIHGQLPTNAQENIERDLSALTIRGPIFAKADSAKPFDLEKYTEWTTLVSNYSRRHLTVLSDRLPALSGVAEKFQQAWGGKYHAGIWPHHFIQLLSWRHDSSITSEPLVRHSLCRAPSWSWASIEGAINFEFKWGPEPGKRKVPAAELVLCSVEPAIAQLQFGEVKSGYATLEGQLVLASTTPMAAATNYERGEIYWDELPPNPQFDEEMKEDHWCFLLGESWTGSDKKGRSTSSVALIVVPIKGVRDTYKRVGLHKLLGKNPVKAWGGVGNRRRITLI